MDTKSVTNTPPLSDVAGQRGISQTLFDKGMDKAKKADAKGRQDWNVDLSPKAREMSEAYRKAAEIARSTPDVREDRVAALKKEVQAGTYKPDSGKIADSMMREAIRERLAEAHRADDL